MRRNSTLRMTMVACLAMLLSFGLTAAENATVGAAAPDFTLTDLNGKTHMLSDYKGKVVVLEWTNPNCPFVVRHYEDNLMTALQKKYGEKNVVWFAINSTHREHRDFESAESLTKIFDGWNAAYTAQLVDADGKVGKMYNAQTTPHMYIVDAEGILLYNGGIDDDPRGSKKFDERSNYVLDALETILNGKSISTSTTRPYGCSVKYTKDT